MERTTTTTVVATTKTTTSTPLKTTTTTKVAQTTSTTTHTTTSTSTTTSTFTTRVRTTLPAATGTITQAPINDSSSGISILALGIGIAIFLLIACCVIGIYMFVIRKKSAKESLHLYELMDKKSRLTVPTGSRALKPAYNFANGGPKTFPLNDYRLGNNSREEPEPVYHDPYINGGGYVIPITNGYIDTYHIDKSNNHFATSQEVNYFEPNDQAYYGDDRYYYEEQVPNRLPVQNHQGGSYADNYYGHDHFHQPSTNETQMKHDLYYDQYDSHKYKGGQDYHDSRCDTIISTDSEALENFKTNIDSINPRAYNNRDSIGSTDSGLSVYKDYKNAYSKFTNDASSKKSPLRNAYRDSNTSFDSDDSYIYKKNEKK